MWQTREGGKGGGVERRKEEEMPRRLRGRDFGRDEEDGTL